MENILEAPRGQRKVWNGKCYNAACKCDPTAARYPCVGNVCTGPNGTCLPAAGPVPGCVGSTGLPALHGGHGAAMTPPAAATGGRRRSRCPDAPPVTSRWCPATGLDGQLTWPPCSLPRSRRSGSVPPG